MTIFAYFLLLFPISANCDCDRFFPDGFGRVFDVKVGSNFEQSLRRVRSEDVIALNIINGTHWLNLGGDVETFEAVIGEPPATSSEVTLIQALDRINQTSPNKKALISFEPKNFALEYLPTLQKYSGAYPLWVDFKGSVDAQLMPMIELPGKSYGLDEVFKRVHSENLLLHHDFYRMKAILTAAFDKHEVDDSQKIYLQRKYKTIKRQNPNSFTELFMSTLLHLIEHLHDMDEPQFLPDLQKVDETCTKEDLGSLEDLLQKSECIMLKIRAGIFLKTDCLSTLTNFLYNHDNLKLVVYALPHDTMPIKDLVTALNVIGQDSVLLDLPKTVRMKMQALSGYTAVDDLSDDDYIVENASNYVTARFQIVILVAFSILVLNRI